MYLLIQEYVDVHINLKKLIYNLENYVHMIWRIWYRIRMYVIHTIWRIQPIDMDEWWQMDVDGRKGQMDVDRRRMAMKGDIDRIVTDDNCDGQQWQWTTRTMDGNCNGQQLRQ
jgi:hypothetical protein